jgi:hypothetical protein
MWNTASVMPSVLSTSNLGLSLISLLTKTISRNTANRCSYAFDHFAVDEGDARRALDIELDAALALQDADIERFITFQQFLAIVDGAAAIEHSQCAATQSIKQATLAGIEQFGTSALERTSRCPSGEIRVSTTSCSMMRKSLFNFDAAQVRPQYTTNRRSAGLRLCIPVMVNLIAQMPQLQELCIKMPVPAICRLKWRPLGTPRGSPRDFSIIKNRRSRMSGATTTNTEAKIPEFKQIMGHPAPLWMLFMTEFWERFAFYGIRWALVLYVVAQFYSGDPTGESAANLVYGSYLALVYAAALFGGYVADRVLGYQRSILVGASFMAAGLFMIAFPDQTVFKFGLATIIVGNGMFKPNISTMVGKLYGAADPRRDSGFTIFYMGINSGALVAPVLTEWLASAVFGTTACLPTKWCSCRLASACWSAWSGSTSAAPSSKASVHRTKAMLIPSAWPTWYWARCA